MNYPGPDLDVFSPTFILSAGGGGVVVVGTRGLCPCSAHKKYVTKSSLLKAAI